MTDPLSTELAEPARSPFGEFLTAVILVVAVVGLMWAIELVDTTALDDRLQQQGIVPRRREGLDGIAFAPFLHLGWPHLIANTVPFLFLGALVGLWGWRRWAVVTVIVVLVGGLATWLVARPGIHIGASGVVFGYFGYLLGAVVYQQRVWPIVPAAVAVVAYGSAIVTGLAPTEGVSWEGHVLGMFAGIFGSRVTGRG